ncbi:MAG: amidase [Lewinellaceae bacterium]|nr:amidase [Saprospiraceae bacterium]MCB9330898.1 amidase [Lewinellaceae bacterium]
MTIDEYRQHDALGLAELVRKGQITPMELLDLAIQRIEAINPDLNAVIHFRYDQAREEAKTADRNAPFAGVPFLVKDLGMEIQGMPMCVGSKGYRDYISEQDSFAVQKMKRAGLLILGKTNTPELGLTPFTEPKLFGPTKNPWNHAHSPGGSSGGSAAAVASGMVPLATANDGGGSIRMPASCCGLFGLKPTRGRVSWSALEGELWSGAAIENCVSRTVRDSAAYLDVIQGAAPGDPYIIAPPKRPYLEEMGAAPGKLRIGWSGAHTLGLPVDGACQKGLVNAVEALRSAGHTVEEVALPYRKEDLTEAFLVVVAGETAAALDLMGAYLGRKVRPSDVEPGTYALNLLGRAFTAGDYAFAKHKWGEITRRIAAFHEKYDLLVTPTLAQRPIRIGALQPTPTEDRILAVINALGLGSAVKATINQLAEKIYGYMPWTALANLTGQPSMSMPFHWTEENLPIGIMFTARMNEEDMLYRLAGQLESAAMFRSYS